jgi:hypothetical protein
MNATPRGRPGDDGAPRRSRDVRLPLNTNPAAARIQNGGTPVSHSS